MSRLSINRSGEMEVFVAAVESGGFSAAARLFNMSPSAVSKLVSRLEARLGTRLVNRSTRRLQLTPEGCVFFEKSARILDSLAEAEAAASAADRPAGRVRLNVSASYATHILAPVLPAFLDRYPEISLDIVQTDAIVDLIEDRSDIAVRAGPLKSSSLIARKLGETRMVIVASPAYLAERSRPLVPTDLLSHACIRVRLPDGSVYRWHFEKSGDTVQVEVIGPMTFDDLPLSRAAVRAGLGIGFFFEQDVIKDIEEGMLVRLLEDWTPPFTGLCLYYPGRRHPSAGLSAFLSLAREMAKRD